MDDDTIQFTWGEIREAQRKLLDRMVELRWVSKYAWSDTAQRTGISFTPDGRRALEPVLIAMNRLSCRDAAELCALEGIVNQVII